MVNSLVPGRVNIGRIDLLSSYSLFDVEKSSAPKVVGALKGNEFYGHRIYAELATDKDYSAPKGKRKGKEEGGRRTNENVTGIPEGTIRKAGPDETALPPRQREAHTRPRRENDKCAVAQPSDS